MCVNGTHWPAGVLILSKETCRCVPMVPNRQSVCRYCPKRLVGVCLWYQMVSRCVDIVLIDLSECVNGTHWPACVLMLSKKILVCGYITGTTWSGKISDNILDTSNEFIGFHRATSPGTRVE